MNAKVFTIGHSNHLLDRFISLLKQHSITAICDVRSKPYSRINPQFNREALKQSLYKNGIAYVFLGRELGARSEDSSCYVHGKVQYDNLAKTSLFREGLDRVQEGIKGYRVALMCAEKDPLECHRTILVGRHLVSRGIDVEHIHSDGHVESHTQALNRLLRQLHLSEVDMFRTRKELLDEAYNSQGQRIAYEKSESASDDESIWIISK